MNRGPLRVLGVDDNENVRRGICQVLHSQGDIEVICEGVDGVDAVAKAREHLPDFVLLDITMPNMNGLELEFSSKNFPRSRSSSSVNTILGDLNGLQWGLGQMDLL
jgi:DNA-binding NarL/FixJ family response regulator